jgi:UDP-N-acetylglucosamine--N-acetylmuramyl-(pentapeptide) pyrophosphoryl-undecaprenol N-acetylglucosamine transferase
VSQGTVLIAGGGTGGHVFPTLATAAALRELAPAVAVEFVGTERGLESRLVPAAGWTLHRVQAAPLARKVSPSTLRLPGVLAGAAREVARLIRERDVRAAAVFGGYVAVPLALAAWRTGTPLVVHEQNAIPGVANRAAARRARTVAVSFPGAMTRFRHRDVVLVGNPVRPEMAGIDRAALRAEALAHFGLDPARRTLLVFGGSQGARRINDAVVAAAGMWADPGQLQMLHAAGGAEHERVQAAWQAAAPGGPLVRCESFIDRMDLAYAAADLVLCRSGASSIAELTVLGLPAVLVPYPHATADHQTANALEVAAAGGALVVPDAELDAARLVEAVQPLLANAGALAEMARAARGFGRPDAARELADLILSAIAPDRIEPGGRT